LRKLAFLVEGVMKEFLKTVMCASESNPEARLDTSPPKPTFKPESLELASDLGTMLPLKSLIHVSEA
jgi:hypothetical protein